MPKLMEYSIPLRSSAGVVLAHVKITPMRDVGCDAAAPLLEIPDADAREHGETIIQLRESERYEYEVETLSGADLRLRSSLSSRRRSFSKNRIPDAGLIETRSFCGTLLLGVVEGEVSDTKPAVASALIDVRSVKLDYRTEYRGMLRRLADEMAGLVADVRSSAKIGFRSSFNNPSDAGWHQIQLELLRESLDSTDFSAALNQIINFPHECISTTPDSAATDRHIRWNRAEIRQLVSNNPRRVVPSGHALRENSGLETVAGQIFIPRKTRDLDTLENRFVKFALGDILTFLNHSKRVFESTEGWNVSAALAQRLAENVESWLGKRLFCQVGRMHFAPLGSPVLQRKAGYRELLNLWLRFRTAAELAWDGGKDLFYAGQRDVASLYEYWLFFELLGWFCRKCRGGSRPPIEELIVGLDVGSPNLRLKKHYQLGPFEGSFGGLSRKLNARFAYNRRFEVTQERHLCGSWTRRLHPDYTLTFWPAELPSEEEAERQELLVHLHFDAKYRVENIQELFGADEEGLSNRDLATKIEEEEKSERDGNYKRQDLLKMHAYRDAIKRSQGAYVLYPGRGDNQPPFRGFHEILPGLGAFGIAPDRCGAAQGFESLERFLDEVLVHLGNRTTAQERVSYHLAESYTQKDGPVSYRGIILPEQDELSDTTRALPPSEHHVVIAWYENDAQLQWIMRTGLAVVRLGDRYGTWEVQPEFASARHVLLHTHKSRVLDGLLALKKRKPGYKIFTATDLSSKGYPSPIGGDIYAIFEVEPDPIFGRQKWDGHKLQKVMTAFESRRKYREIKALGSLSAVPRILSLQELLKAMQ